MVRTLLELQPVPGRAAELVGEIESLGVLDRHARAQAGFLGGEILREGGLVFVLAAWTSEAAYEGWLANPIRETLVRSLLPLLEHPPSGRVLCVVGATEPEPPS
jgi:quinol monooxygenase YgiN